MNTTELPRALPTDSILIHIGPHKTGTTALQLALNRTGGGSHSQNQDFRYVTAGNRENANVAVMALAERPSDQNLESAPFAKIYWDSFVTEINSTRVKRIAISAEAFADLDANHIATTARKLSNRTAHILLALRPIGELLPSQWQQMAQRGNESRPFSVWLKETLAEWSNPRSLNQFWHRHHYGRLITRWSQEFGVESVTGVVLDRNDRDRLFRVTEHLLGLTQGLLLNNSSVKNRSLTLEEVEALRRMYEVLESQNLGYLSRNLRAMLSPSELIKRHRIPLTSEQPILIPAQFKTQIEDIQLSLNTTVQPIGINLIGNLATLESGDLKTVAADQLVASIPIDLTGWIAAGIIEGSGLSKGWVPPIRNPKTPISLPDVWLKRATGRQLLTELIRRLTSRVSKRS